MSRVQPGIEPGTSWMAVRRANHYTKQVVIGARNEWLLMIMISRDGWGLNFPDVYLTVEEKLRKNPSQENGPDRG